VKKFLFLVVLIVGSVTWANGSEKIDFDQRAKQLFLSQPFVAIDRVAKIPSNFAECLRTNRMTKMAEPDKPFQVGCDGDGSLPLVRLILAGYSGKYFFISYERGGRAHLFKLDFFRIDKNKSVLIGTFSPGPKKFKSIEEIKTAVKELESN
jgi:hypothetical protein